MDSFWNQVTPAIGYGLATLITLAVTWAAAAFQRLTSIRIEEKHQATLHSALLTGASWAVSMYGGNAKGNMQAVIDYARRSAPDAFKALDPPNAVLQQMATAKIEQVQNPNVGLVAR